MTNLDRTFMTAQELIYTKEVLTQEEYEICLIYWPAAAKAHLIHRPGTTTYLNLNLYSEVEKEEYDLRREIGV